MQAEQLLAEPRPATWVTEPTTGVFPEELAPDDLTLIERMAGGDARSLEPFYTRWEHTVRGALFLRESDFQNTDDAVAEVFWHIWTESSCFDAAGGTVEHWVLGIARATCLARCRRETPREPSLVGTTSC
jgi:DNA-directed RNA polymerase specialized sigma24 family protein